MQRKLLRYAFFFLTVSLRVEVIDAKEVEARADEILVPVSSNECDLLLSKLGGMRRNRVFHFFGVEAPQRTAEALLMA